MLLKVIFLKLCEPFLRKYQTYAKVEGIVLQSPSPLELQKPSWLIYTLTNSIPLYLEIIKNINNKKRVQLL